VSLPTPLTTTQLDALRELANVAAGHTATALSARLKGEAVHFQPPLAGSVTEGQLTEWLGGKQAAKVAAGFEVQGDVHGALWLVVSLADAAELAAPAGAGKGPAEGQVDEALGEGLRAALAAMGRLTGLVFTPAALLVRRCSAPALAKSLAAKAAVLALRAGLQAGAFQAELLFFPEGGTLAALLHSLGVG